MEREKPRQAANQEKKENLNGHRVVYRFSDDAEGEFKVTRIKQQGEDPITSYVLQEIREIESDIKKKRQEKFDVSKKTKHGGKRLSKKRVSEIREAKEKEIEVLEVKRRILSGEEQSPVVFVRKGDEITDSNLSLSQRESHLWSYVKDKPELLKLDPEDYELVTKAYFIRYGLRFDPSRKSQYDEEWDEVRKELRKEENDHLTPYIVDIVSHLT